MAYITTKQYAALIGSTERWAQLLCKKGIVKCRIVTGKKRGGGKRGGIYEIPTSSLPADLQVKYLINSAQSKEVAETKIKTIKIRTTKGDLLFRTIDLIEITCYSDSF
jgi:hypothetical protein